MATKETGGLCTLSYNASQIFPQSNLFAKAVSLATLEQSELRQRDARSNREKESEKRALHHFRTIDRRGFFRSRACGVFEVQAVRRPIVASSPFGSRSRNLPFLSMAVFSLTSSTTAACCLTVYSSNRTSLSTFRSCEPVRRKRPAGV